LGPEHHDTLTDMSNLADVYRDEGEYVQAEALDSQTLEIERRVLGAEHPNTLYTLSDFASVYQRQGKKYALAETYAAQALAGRRHALYHVDRAREWLVQFYQASGKPDKAAEWSKK
jgi:eukaryotic-like serine/threonine-protein kinase